MRKITTIKLNTRRIQEIINYDYSLGNLVNINFRKQLLLNPIGGETSLKVLKELREELDSYDISSKEIDCNRVYGGNSNLTETERFIMYVNDGRSYLNYLSDYKKMKEAEELDRDFPREERQKIVDELEIEIKREYRKIETVCKLNKTLRRTTEAKISELSNELRNIIDTLEVPTEEYINNMLYLIATSKIAEIKNRLDSKICYLEDVMEEIA